MGRMAVREVGKGKREMAVQGVGDRGTECGQKGMTRILEFGPEISPAAHGPWAYQVTSPSTCCDCVSIVPTGTR